MTKYSPVPGSAKATKAYCRLLKSPILFYFLLIGVSFGAGYLSRTLVEYWQLASRIRGAHGRDLTVKHVNVAKISAPTNSEPTASEVQARPASDGLLGRTAPPMAAVTKAKVAAANNRPKPTCSSCNLGLCEEPDPGYFTEVSTEIQLFLTMQFPCSGVVTQWKFIDYNPTPGKTVYIDAIRYINASDQGTWMGFNAVKTNGQSGWQTYDVPKDEQLTVEKGWLIAIHYDDVNDDGVIPHATDPASGLQLYDGFGLLMDHQELRRLAPLREASRVPISAALKQLLVELHLKWRAPALAAIVTPSTSS